MGNLLHVEVFQRGRHFIFTFLVKNDFEDAGIVINFEKCAHGFFLFADNTANDNDLQQAQNYAWKKTYILDRFSVDLAHIVGSRRGFLNHAHGDGCKHAVLSALAAQVLLILLAVSGLVAAVLLSPVAIHVGGHEKAVVVATCKLQWRVKKRGNLPFVFPQI